MFNAQTPQALSSSQPWMFSLLKWSLRRCSTMCQQLPHLLSQHTRRLPVSRLESTSLGRAGPHSQYNSLTHGRPVNFQPVKLVEVPEIYLCLWKYFGGEIITRNVISNSGKSGFRVWQIAATNLTEGNTLEASQRCHPR